MEDNPSWSSDVSELRTMTILLTEAYRRAAVDIAAGLRGWPEGTEPLEAQDPNGRYVLVDALTVLVSARTALVQSWAEHDRG